MLIQQLFIGGLAHYSYLLAVFGMLGYCPGTIRWHRGEVSFDALLCGLPGVMNGVPDFSEFFWCAPG